MRDTGDLDGDSDQHKKKKRRHEGRKGMSDDDEKICNVMVMNAATDNESRAGARREGPRRGEEG